MTLHAQATSVSFLHGSILIAVDDGIGDHAFGEDANDIVHARARGRADNNCRAGPMALQPRKHQA